MIEVVNKRNVRLDETCVYIGRPSALGNPFVIGRDGTREEVIAKYREHFRSRLLHDKRAQALLDEIGDAHACFGHVQLVCWCAPCACHGDVIKEYFELAFK